MNRPNIDELKKMIVRAEEELEKLVNDSVRRLKQRRIKRALEKAYATLNRQEYTQEEIDKRTRQVWRSLQDGVPIIWVYIFGIIFACSFIFAAYETYSFLNNTTNKSDIWPWNNDEDKYDLSELVAVNYGETNVVSLYDLIPVDDNVGVNNKKQTFSISNNSTTLPTNIDYDVDYVVNIVEMNSKSGKVLDKKFIKYQIVYTENGNTTKTDIGRLSDLQKVGDNKYVLFSGTQPKNTITNFEVAFWLASDATDDEQGAAYTFAFFIDAGINKK